LTEADILFEFTGEEEPKVKIKPTKRKKTINQKKKGNAGELELVHILNERFKDCVFARSVSSGAYTGGMNAVRAEALTAEQKLVFAGDIRTPVNFRFTLEHKSYKSANFWDLFNDKSELKGWIDQAIRDANGVERIPLLIIKYNNKQRIVYCPVKLDSYIFEWGGWYVTWLETLLKNDDTFFFKRQ
jgi:hypothetical protein